MSEQPGLDERLETLTSAQVPFKEIIGALHDGVVVVDRNGTIVYANPAYTRILNVPVERIVGRRMQDVEPGARILTVLKTRKPILRDSFHLDSLDIDVVISATPIFQDGQLVGGVTVFRDSQELLEIYAAYRRAHGLVDYYRDLLTKERGHDGSFDPVVGRSRALGAVIKMAEQVAKTDATVLITGENGVGKDVLAQAIHRASLRADKPLITVNCAAIPDTLLESELFGFDRGAFTGAARAGKIGKIELADEGTLFLDEVGDMTPSMQAKLLRMLQNQEIEKLGSNRVVKVNVRVLAATNCDLKEMMQDGRFRADLFYRLNVFPIHVPPLRARKDDVSGLAQHFLDEFCSAYKKRIVMAPETFEALERHPWPGNIRELRNAVERAVIVCVGDVLLPEDLGPAYYTESEAANEATPAAGLKGEVRRAERKAYEEALQATGGNKSRAMALLGVSRRTFYKRLVEFNIGR